MSAISSEVSKLIRIDIKEIPERMKYQELVRRKDPIFFNGDTIKGSIFVSTIDDLTSIKHRSISIRIFGSTVGHQQIISQHDIVTKKIAKDGVLDLPTRIDFDFKGVRFPSPSFLGYKFKYKYFIEVNISTGVWNTDYTSFRHIIVLEPETAPISKSPSTIRIDSPFINFDFYFDKGVYATNDVINGQIAFGLTKGCPLKEIFINLIVNEKYKDNNEETQLLHYQIMDGCPKSGTTLPVIIHLSPYKIYTLREGNKTSAITSEFFVEIQAIATNGNISISKQQFPLYFPAISA